jgi:hypothetical protein
MVVLPTREDLSQASGIVDFDYLNIIYESVMDEALVGMGKQIVLHLQPSISEDKSVAQKIDPGAYNPFFKNASRISAGGKGKGVIITSRDIPYTAHIAYGPRPLNEQTGAGELSDGQVQTTTSIESLQDIESAISMTVDGNRYDRFGDAKVIGLSNSKYVIQVWGSIAEKEQ